MEVLQKPYTIQEIKEKLDENERVTGRVSVLLSEIINCDLEQFLDLLAVRLVDNECLTDIHYKAVGIDNDEMSDVHDIIIIEVSDNVSEILDMEDN